MNNITKDGKVWLLTTFVRSLKGHRESSSSSGSYQSVMKMWTLPSLRSSFSHRRPGRFDLLPPPPSIYHTETTSRLPPLGDVRKRGCCGFKPKPQQPKHGLFSKHGLLPQTPGARAGEGTLVRCRRTPAPLWRVSADRQALERIQPLWVRQRLFVMLEFYTERCIIGHRSVVVLKWVRTSTRGVQDNPALMLEYSCQLKGMSTSVSWGQLGHMPASSSSCHGLFLACWMRSEDTATPFSFS